MRLILLGCEVLTGPVVADPPKKPYELFIAVDDLNHWVGHLGRNPRSCSQR